jgi:hypothetical protein
LFSFSNAAPRRNAHIGVNSTPTCLHIASVLVFRSEISTFALCAGSKNRESLSSIICVQVHRGVAICGACWRARIGATLTSAASYDYVIHVLAKC